MRALQPCRALNWLVAFNETAARDCLRAASVFRVEVTFRVAVKELLTEAKVGFGGSMAECVRVAIEIVMSRARIYLIK